MRDPGTEVVDLHSSVKGRRCTRGFSYFFSIFRSQRFFDAKQKLALFLRFPIDPLFQPPTIFPFSTALPKNQQGTLPSTTDPPTAVRVVLTTKPSCPPGKFQCRDGQCIDANWRCDRYDDCRDMSDEQNCPCRSNQMTCANGVCVNKIWMCDGSDDCGDNSDEKNCSAPTSPPCKERTIILLRGRGERFANCPKKTC